MNKHIGLVALVALAAFGGVAPALAEQVTNPNRIPFSDTMIPAPMMIAGTEQVSCTVDVDLREIAPQMFLYELELDETKSTACILVTDDQPLIPHIEALL